MDPLRSPLFGLGKTYALLVKTPVVKGKAGKLLLELGQAGKSLVYRLAEVCFPRADVVGVEEGESPSGRKIDGPTGPLLRLLATGEQVEAMAVLGKINDIDHLASAFKGEQEVFANSHVVGFSSIETLANFGKNLRAAVGDIDHCPEPENARQVTFPAEDLIEIATLYGQEQQWPVDS